MINFNVTGTQRKRLVQTLTKLTGEPAKYLGMPSCGYRVGDYTVSKAGEITPHPTPELLEGLASAGFTGEETERGTVITISRKGMTETAVTCFENMLNSKRPLIRRALGLQSTLPIEVTEESIIIRWFEMEEPEPESLDAAKKLINGMIKHAKKAKRISPTPVRSDNPKYNFRVFLNSLGFIGDEYKPLRKTLLKNLEGSSAWRFGERREQA